MTVNASKLGPGVLTLGETGSPKEFGSQITNARIEPSYDTEDPIPVLSGEEVPGDTGLANRCFTYSGPLLATYA